VASHIRNDKHWTEWEWKQYNLQQESKRPTHLNKSSTWSVTQKGDKPVEPVVEIVETLEEWTEKEEKEALAKAVEESMATHVAGSWAHYSKDGETVISDVAGTSVPTMEDARRVQEAEESKQSLYKDKELNALRAFQKEIGRTDEERWSYVLWTSMKSKKWSFRLQGVHSKSPANKPEYTLEDYHTVLGRCLNVLNVKETAQFRDTMARCDLDYCAWWEPKTPAATVQGGTTAEIVEVDPADPAETCED